LNWRLDAPGSFALCESGASATNVFYAKAKRQQQMFSVAKAKRQLKSSQSERKSTTRFGDDQN